ncbi:hypothetical protein quinque_002420 [Culex quinquefasciatus]
MSKIYLLQQWTPIRRNSTSTMSAIQLPTIVEKLLRSSHNIFQQESQPFECLPSSLTSAVEPVAANPAVQQFIPSACPNIQRSLSALSQTAAGGKQFSAPPPQPSMAN